MVPIRFHHLRAAGRSPAHARAALDGDEMQPTTAMERGTAVHSLVLGGRRVEFYPGAVRRGKEWEAFEAANADADVLTRAEYDKACRMADAVMRNGDAVRVLDGAIKEKPIEWKWMGRACRATPDARNVDLVELKTTKDAHPERFARMALWSSYHAQLAWYRLAIETSGNGTARDAYVIAVESVAPYPVTVLRLTKRAMEKGDQLVRLWWERLRACEEANTWPGYVQSVVDLDVPEDDELIFGSVVDAVEAA